MKLTFYGAAGEVTGSCHVLDIDGHRVLLDCGMIQGAPADEARNRDPFPFDPATIDAVILSHAHLDHSGRLPLLLRRGFRGRIVTHNATRDLARVLLRDAAYLAGLSAHGDAGDLLRWYDALGPHPPVYLVHGEPKSADALAAALVRQFGADVTVAEPGTVVDLDRLSRAA